MSVAGRAPTVAENTGSADDNADAAADDALEQVGQRIDEAHRDAEEAGLIDDPDERRYVDSGERGRGEDDQTITPPG